MIYWCDCMVIDIFNSLLIMVCCLVVKVIGDLCMNFMVFGIEEEWLMG